MGAGRESVWRKGGVKFSPALTGGTFPFAVAQPLLQHPEVIVAEKRFAVGDHERNSEHPLRNSVFNVALQQGFDLGRRYGGDKRVRFEADGARFLSAVFCARDVDAINP